MIGVAPSPRLRMRRIAEQLGVGLLVIGEQDEAVVPGQPRRGTCRWWAGLRARLISLRPGGLLTP